MEWPLHPRGVDYASSTVACIQPTVCRASAVAPAGDREVHELPLGLEQRECLDGIPMSLDWIQVADGEEKPIVRFEPQLGAQGRLLYRRVPVPLET